MAPGAPPAAVPSPQGRSQQLLEELQELEKQLEGLKDL
jgi:hypothetical protein